MGIDRVIERYFLDGEVNGLREVLNLDRYKTIGNSRG